MIRYHVSYASWGILSAPHRPELKANFVAFVYNSEVLRELAVIFDKPGQRLALCKLALVVIYGSHVGSIRFISLFKLSIFSREEGSSTLTGFSSYCSLEKRFSSYDCNTPVEAFHSSVVTFRVPSIITHLFFEENSPDLPRRAHTFDVLFTVSWHLTPFSEPVLQTQC